MNLNKYKSLTFCIPVMDRISYIKKTLKKNLDDNYEDKENVCFILIDFNSNDKLEDYIKDNFKKYIDSNYLKYIKKKRLIEYHMSIAKNSFINYINTDIYSNLDADNFTGYRGGKHIIDVFNKYGRCLYHQFTGVWNDGSCGKISLLTKDYKKYKYEVNLYPRNYDEISVIIHFIMNNGLLLCGKENIITKSYFMKIFYEQHKFRFKMIDIPYIEYNNEITIQNRKYKFYDKFNRLYLMSKYSHTKYKNHYLKDLFREYSNNKKLNIIADKKIPIITNLISIVLQKIIVITSYFNYGNNIYMKYNYIKFRENLEKQNIKLITIELSDNNKFDLTNYSDVYFYNIKDYLWHKENCFNIILNKISKDVECICWIDNDIIFLDNDWLIQLYNKMFIENINIIQLFKHVKRCSITNEYSIIEPKINGWCENTYMESELYQHKINNFTNAKTPGYAWAIKREILTKMNGFYDKCILGGADRIILDSIFMNKNNGLYYYKKSLFYNDLKSYMEKLHNLIDNKFDYLDITIVHLYHGDYNKRAYNSRYKILDIIPDLDPNINLIKVNDILQWNDLDKNKVNILNKLIKQYFTQRIELNYMIINEKTILHDFNYDELYEILFFENININQIISIISRLTKTYFIVLLDYNISGILKDILQFISTKICNIKRIKFNKNSIINSDYKSNNKIYFNNAITTFFN